MDKKFYVVTSVDSNYLSKVLTKQEAYEAKVRFGDGSKVEFFSYDENSKRYTVWSADIVKRVDKRTKETEYMRICSYIERFQEVGA